MGVLGEFRDSRRGPHPHTLVTADEVSGVIGIQGYPRASVGVPGVHICMHWLLLSGSVGVLGGFGGPKSVHTCTHWLLLSATMMRPALDVEIPCKLVNSPFSRPRLPAGTGQGGTWGPRRPLTTPVNPCHPLDSPPPP